MTDQQPAARPSEAAIQYRLVPGQFNAMAICSKCDADASTVRMSRYVEYAISGEPLLCDGCWNEQNTDRAMGAGEPVAAPDTAALVEENARLRQALADIANQINVADGPLGRAYAALDEVTTDVKRKARTALIAQHKGTEHG